jgi:hypothetical protein
MNPDDLRTTPQAPHLKGPTSQHCHIEDQPPKHMDPWGMKFTAQQMVLARACSKKVLFFQYAFTVVLREILLRDF